MRALPLKVKEKMYPKAVGLCPTTLPLNYTTHIKGKSFLKLYLITDASAMHRPFPPGRDHWVRSLGLFITPPVISSPIESGVTSRTIKSCTWEKILCEHGGLHSRTESHSPVRVD